MSSQAIFPAISLSQLQIISKPGSEIYSTLGKHLEPYIEETLKNPENVKAVAGKLLMDARVLFLLFSALQKTTYEAGEKDLIEAFRFLKSLSKKFKDAGIDVDEAFSIIAEHEEWKFRKLKGEFERFVTVTLDFMNYPEDLYEYAVIYFSLFLLLFASYETEAHEKLRSIGKELKNLAEKLENYTLTFMLAFEENEEIAATARTPEEVKRVLRIE
jgi:hypothetical protein